MNRKEYDSLVRLIEEKIRIAGPRQAEYYRGYLRGIRVHFQKSIEGTAKKAVRTPDLPCGGSCSTHLDPYPRGYRDGCVGSKPAEVT